MAPPTKKKEATGDLMISTAEYKKTRDSVIASLHNLQAGLIHVQHGITDLLTNYRKHCASVLGGEEGEIPPFNDVAAVAASVMEAGRNAVDETKQVLAPVDKSAEASKGKKRKREKKEKDPNAPKKPLTAAFLYHQHARPIVKADLEAALPPGGQIEKNAVQLEVNKRWNELPEEEKEQWKASYRNSMEEYKAELAEYIANKGIKATELVEEDEGSDDADIEVEVGAADSDASSEDEEEAPAKAPSPPAKTPRKRQKTTPAVNGNSAPIPIAPAATNSTPVPLPNARTSQAPAPAPTTTAAAETPVKKDTKKRKEKAAPQPIAPAPASSHEDEPAPEETVTTKKKTKSSRSTRNTEADGDKENAALEKAEKAEKAGKEKKRDRSKRKVDSS
ncbi:hypothetical protein COCSADRAFT_175386 [Bipolaris sorokiniana ND90Pr]|uniref:HMG box domain-containing protein n=1 Tax=Cochliobolus sativus (strain ND90Pr / ATCC 201652) TaxID=665912 RepID=M2RWS1_COCSN|nr:uncharacterized protein COCSADRAFT_175386 [Bipolaris sorokiniana ND90Pr]EMD59523.1 hypothetical protein COCSADRAFT_175386 [Bipolaris sorokiniana ND90Pr]